MPPPDPSPAPAEPSTRRKGGRPRGNPADVRATTIGVRVSVAEHEALKVQATQMGLSPAQWLRDAALKRRLPSPPVPEANRTEYAQLARLSANLNQLARAANEGRPVSVDATLLQHLASEVGRLRRALLGLDTSE